MSCNWSFHSFISIVQSNNDSIHPSIHLSVCRWVGGEVVLFLRGCCFIKINKWYLCSGVESITNGSWRKGNLGRSALAKEQNGFLLWSITNALQNTSEVYWKSQVPLTPPLWKWPTLSWPTWLDTESHFQKVRGEVSIAVAHRNRRPPGRKWSKRWSS